jgi:hypothetical protein
MITRIFAFSGSGYGPLAPVDPVSGSFQVTFDPSSTSFGNVDFFASNLNYPGPYSFNFLPFQFSGELVVGNACHPFLGCSAASGSDNVIVDIFGAATASPFLNELDYSSTTSSVLEASSLALTFTDVVPQPAPEPSSWLLVCLGVAALRLFLKGKTKTAVLQ